MLANASRSPEAFLNWIKSLRQKKRSGSTDTTADTCGELTFTATHWHLFHSQILGVIMRILFVLWLPSLIREGFFTLLPASIFLAKSTQHMAVLKLA